MNAHTLFRAAVTVGATLLISTTGLWAFCNSSIETYALFQCSELGYFAPVPPAASPPDGGRSDEDDDRRQEAEPAAGSEAPP